MARNQLRGFFQPGSHYHWIDIRDIDLYDSGYSMNEVSQPLLVPDTLVLRLDKIDDFM